VGLCSCRLLSRVFWSAGGRLELLPRQKIIGLNSVERAGRSLGLSSGLHDLRALGTLQEQPGAGQTHRGKGRASPGG